jgi:hypothetical protein
MMQHPLGISLLPSNMVGLAVPVQSNHLNSQLQSSRYTVHPLQGKAMLHHVILKGILRQALRGGRVASMQEAMLCRLRNLKSRARNGSLCSSGAGRAGSDILLTI